MDACTSPDALFTVVGVDLAVVRCLPQVPRAAVADMPDRLIAATALALGVPLITKDARIQSTGITTIW